MSDPILELYKERDRIKAEEKAREVRRKQETDEQERLRLLETIPDALDSMFERLELTGYSDELIIGSIRPVKSESGDVRELVTWVVGSTDDHYTVNAGMVCESIFVSSERTFYRWLSLNYSEKEPLELVQIANLRLRGVQGVLTGIQKVGQLRATYGR